MNQLLFQPLAFIASFYIFSEGGGGTERLVFNPAVLIASLYVFALAAFLGYQVISATNAISGISLIGSLVIAGSTYESHQQLAELLGCAAVTSAMINVTGGFLITDRMLKMFRKKEAVKPEEKK
jgi:NAD(P) transhydrogenase subunit alpha